MTDEQKAQMHKGPWKWEGVEFENGKKDGKWIVPSAKQWGKYVQKVKKEEEKAQGKADAKP